MSMKNVTWNPPQQGFIKCNLDVAFFEDTKTFGLGMCLRDSEGNFIKAMTYSLDLKPWFYKNHL